MRGRVGNRSWKTFRFCESGWRSVSLQQTDLVRHIQKRQQTKQKSDSARMRVPNVSSRSSVGANMTPMIDVVFLLIIFFLVSSHLAKQENRLPLDLPTAGSFLPADFEAAPLTISVDQNADIRVSARVVQMEDLKGILVDHFSEQGVAAAIRIRTDRSVEYRYVEPILREAARIGITDASIAVRELQQ